MKIRFTGRSIRVRLDDLETDMLLRRQPLEQRLSWPGGGWGLRLDPARHGVTADGSDLTVGLADDLATLLDPLQEGVSLEAFGGDLRLRIEKDFTPEHLA
ncbi:DUF7009 family protein [Deinococcus aquiradiocola]|uniref:Uncharacterized protein n=1 Tax=Deinococcus aquiradiocola TaxID=393059 RepID=A0A917UUC0_9DEIO|nr:hypothetical protein [Deinococcus aquiradiocola]GGJ85750.1 hypothetical protein GCM10008939_32040 [Deinococcus aquiradiocola]